MLGAIYHPKTKKWLSWYSTIYLGSYEDEISAAKQYDTYILLKYGDTKPTNNLVKLEEVKDIDIQTLVKEKIKGSHPPNIYAKGNFFEIKMKCKVASLSLYSVKHTIEEALLTVKEFKEKIKKELNINITRNSDGIAIIPVKKKDETVYSTVSDDKWNDIMQYKWHVNSTGYIEGTVEGKILKLHRYIMNATEDQIVEHIDKNKLNNVTENLRFTTFSISNHTKKINYKNKSSKYTGVRLHKTRNKWMSEIYKDKKCYFIGYFENENDAAMAYNNKAKELYGEFAKLNIINE